MIVKGHDFGNVTLVGIMAADLSLNAPDTVQRADVSLPRPQGEPAGEACPAMW